MPRLTREDRVVRQIIKAHGSTLDLQASPETLVEIIRKWGPDLIESEPGFPPDGGVGPTGPAGTARPTGPPSV